MQRGTANELSSERKGWDASLYDARHSFVWKYGEALIELLTPQKGERILDLGCGTGHLSQQISLSGADVIGLDRSPAMIEQARKSYPHLRFVVADAADFEFPEPFDAVFSNAALHWMTRADEVASCIARALKPGGRLVAEFGGKGNIKALQSAIRKALGALSLPDGEQPNLWYFPSIGEYASLVEEHHLAVTFASLFDRPTALEDGENGLRQWLDMFASELLTRLSSRQQSEFAKAVEDQLRPILYRGGTWFADYRRIRIIAVRE